MELCITTHWADVFPCRDWLSALWPCLLTCPLLQAPWWFVQACPAYELFTQALRMSAAVSLGNFTALQEGTLICFTPVVRAGLLVPAWWLFRLSVRCCFVLSLHDGWEVVSGSFPGGHYMTMVNINMYPLLMKIVHLRTWKVSIGVSCNIRG